jgi:hypothetical protein
MSGISDREMIKRAYPQSVKWSGRVDKMSDSQVTAILLRLRRKGIIP